MCNHTPNPWKIAEYIDSGRAIRRDTHAHNNGGQQQIAHVNSNNHEADARFIVRACNAHFALVEVLGYCIGFLAGEQSNTDQDREEILEYAHTAIAMAQGKQVSE